MTKGDLTCENNLDPRSREDSWGGTLQAFRPSMDQPFFVEFVGNIDATDRHFFVF